MHADDLDVDDIAESTEDLEVRHRESLDAGHQQPGRQAGDALARMKTCAEFLGARGPRRHPDDVPDPAPQRVLPLQLGVVTTDLCIGAVRLLPLADERGPAGGITVEPVREGPGGTEVATVLAHEGIICRQDMDDAEHRHGDPLDRPGVVLVLDAVTEDAVQHADVADTHVRHDAVAVVTGCAEPGGNLRREPCAHARSGHDQVLGLEEVERCPALLEVAHDGIDDIPDVLHAPDPQRH